MDRSNDVQFTPDATNAQDVEFTADRSVTVSESETSDGMMDQARDQARHLAHEAGHTAKHQVSSRLDQGKDRIADTLGTLARSLEDSGRKLRDDGHGNGLIDQAADRVQQFSNYLRDTNVDEVVDEVQGFARRHSTAFIGGAFALGIIGARFIKASSDRVARERWGRDDPTSRVRSPRDAIGRPGAPGYETAAERGETSGIGMGDRELTGYTAGASADVRSRSGGTGR